MKEKYRVYVETSGGGGTSYGSFLPDQYSQAKSLFDDLVAYGYDAVYLQELSLKYGWVTRTLKKHITEAFKVKKEALWKKLESENKIKEWKSECAPWEIPVFNLA